MSIKELYKTAPYLFIEYQNLITAKLNLERAKKELEERQKIWDKMVKNESTSIKKL